MIDNTNMETMAEALTKGIAAEPEPIPEPEPKKHRRSVIYNEPLPGATAEQLKKRRTRKTKPAELKKTHSFTILMTEQMYQRFKAIAEYKGVSMNGIITRMIRKYIVVHDIDGDDDIDITDI